jgi:transcriptional regulator
LEHKKSSAKALLSLSHCFLSAPKILTNIPMDIAKEQCYLPCNIQRRAMSSERSEVLQGTLDLMILKTLHALGPLHGFGIARRIEQLSEEVLKLNEGTVYTSLLRLQQQGWIVSEWGTSENNRKAKFYSITKRGLKQLAIETENWERISGVIGRVLGQEGQR